MDTLTTAQRSERMSRIRSKDTKPELIVRRMVHGMGYRYRLHRRDLPGTPDLAFPSRRKAIFVHGCLWHQHGECSTWRIPKSRQGFWIEKLNRNTERDGHNQSRLRTLGWDVLVVWECEIKDIEALKGRIKDFLDG